MRILLAHNFYQSGAPSGEDVVYRSERALLEGAGHEIVAFERHNDEITTSPLQRASTAIDSLWSQRSHADLRKLIAATRPDVAHFHNTFPLITASAYRACHDAGVAVVQTLHNYRLLCPGGLFLREGSPCEQCLDSGLAHSIRHGCYRESRVATAVVAAGLQLNRTLGSYTRYVDRYIALTDFARTRFVRAGFPAERIAVRPNGLADAPAMGSGDGNYALYVGRLTREKGVETLLRAWSSIDELPLKIVGDGALRTDLESRYGRNEVEFLGFQPRAEVWKLMQRATMLIIPSECYEGFPMTAVEGFAAGTPIVASALGALDEIVQDPEHGVKFTPTDAAALRSGVRRLLNDRIYRERCRERNRAQYERLYSREEMLSSLIHVYERASGVRAAMTPTAAVR